jgi:DNA-binding PucR family transcriptional regulator
LLDLRPTLEGGGKELDAQVSDVTIIDPDDELARYPNMLVLIIGARGREAVRFVRAAARRGATVAAVKTEGSDAVELVAAARDAGITLLAVRPQTRWEQLESLVREMVTAAAFPAESPDSADLFTLANTLSTLTAGRVSIEDANSRVLAYSRSDDEIDELRRLSILGGHGPESYLALLREWGIFHKLRSSEEIVHVEERKELGIRPRLAVGIRAGTQHLGTIWVQRGATDFADGSESALLGAGRVAAVQILRHRNDSARSRSDLVAGLLTGSASADLVAGSVGIDPSASATVIAFTAIGTEFDRPEHELRLADLVNVVSVHATSFRRNALVGIVNSRVYAILPGVRDNTPSVLAVANTIVDVSRRRSRMSVRAAVGSTVDTFGEIDKSRSEADRVLDVLARRGGGPVATIGDLRAEVLLGETLSMLERTPELRDPAVTALHLHDQRNGTELVRSLLAYLDALGDFRRAAQELHVHPNTLRHRVRRAGTVTGLRLDDPRERLFCHLQLLLISRGAQR